MQSLEKNARKGRKTNLHHAVKRTKTIQVHSGILFSFKELYKKYSTFQFAWNLAKVLINLVHENSKSMYREIRTILFEDEVLLNTGIYDTAG